jgi:hypothetical protein
MRLKKGNNFKQKTKEWTRRGDDFSRVVFCHGETHIKILKARNSFMPALLLPESPNVSVLAKPSFPREETRESGRQRHRKRVDYGKSRWRRDHPLSHMYL